MSMQALKTGFFVSLLSLLLAACAGTTTEDQAAGPADTGAVAGDEVATGTVADSDIAGGDLGAGGVATVFYFEFDKAVLKPEARAALDVHARRLKNNPRQVRIEGHADERGTREYNIALAERRANAVKEYLVLQGVDSSLMEVISYGEERPAALGSDEEAYALNRRVELKEAR